MVQLLLILCGSRVVRRNWWLVFFFGVFWMAIGAVVFSNALFSQSRISPIWFTVPLLFDSVLSLSTAFHAVDRGSNPLGDAKRIQALT